MIERTPRTPEHLLSPDRQQLLAAADRILETAEPTYVDREPPDFIAPNPPGLARLAIGALKKLLVKAHSKTVWLRTAEGFAGGLYLEERTRRVGTKIDRTVLMYKVTTSTTPSYSNYSGYAQAVTWEQDLQAPTLDEAEIARLQGELDTKLIEAE